MQTGFGDTDDDRNQGTSLETEKAWWSLPSLCGNVWVALGSLAQQSLPHISLTSVAFLALSPEPTNTPNFLPSYETLASIVTASHSTVLPSFLHHTSQKNKASL